MELSEVLDRLSKEIGAVRVEIMPDSLCDRITEEEATVTAAGGYMGVNNKGLDDFMARDTHIVAFVTWDFVCPPEITMKMVDEEGHILGHDIPVCDIPKYSDRTDITFLSDDFVMYNDVEPVGESTMEMLAVPYRGKDDWVPAETDPVIWFASSTSAEIIHDHFDQPLDDLATAMIGLNLKG